MVEKPDDTRDDRIDALEARISALEARLDGEDRVPAADRPVTAEHQNADPEPDSRTAPPATSTTTASATTTSASGPDPENRFFALETLKEIAPESGAVLYTGVVRTPEGRKAEWQFARPADDLHALDFANSAASFAALSHPTRLRILQAIYSGTRTVAELAATDDFGTTGQIYHHVNQLAAAGWLRSPARGSWEVPGERIVPLLTLLLITQG